MTFSPLIFFLVIFSFVSTFDPSTFNYCDFKCNETVEHTACKCEVEPPLELLVKRIASFRRKILDIHNEARNTVASGMAQHKNTFVPEASNMRVMNYDLELEYIAKCYAGKFTGTKDSCRKTHNNLKEGLVGQLLGGITFRSDDPHEWTNYW